MKSSSQGSLANGDVVRVFYHMNDHIHGYRYVRLVDAAPEDVPENPAVVGLSTGWMPATVIEDWNPDQLENLPDKRVLVLLHGRFADAYHVDHDNWVNGMCWRAERHHVRTTDTRQPIAELSLFVVRWWDYWKNKKQRSHNVANEDMLLDTLEGGPDSVHEVFKEEGKYEVHSAFVRGSDDLEVVGRQVATAMRGRRKVAMYFLWPTQRVSYERRMPGSVSEPKLLALMNFMESQGTRSCWPHPSTLYRELAGKLWIPRVSDPRVSTFRPELKVPSAVMVDHAVWSSNPLSAAERAIEELLSFRQDTDTRPPPLFRGVVKLGFSWMGEDVKPFTGPQELARVLTQFLEPAAENAVCLVQERIEDVACELRLVCCRDLASGPTAVKKELVRMRLHPPRFHSDSTFSLTSAYTMSPEEAASQAFAGKMDLLRAAEQEASRLTELWLRWFEEEGYGTPVACRFDFLVSRRFPKGPGTSPEISLNTVEVSECGASLCNLHFGPRSTAFLNECMEGTDLEGLPRPLPPWHLPPTSSAAGDQGPNGNNRNGRHQPAGNRRAYGNYKNNGSNNNVRASTTVSKRGPHRLKIVGVLLLLIAIFRLWRRRR